MNFGKNLQALRKAQKLSQEELADKMQVSRQAISKWESGNTYPETEKLIELSKVLGCSVDSLVKDEMQFVSSKPNMNDKSVYSKLMDKFSLQLSIGTMLILLGSSLLLGISALGMPYADYGLVIFLIFVAISVPIFVMGGLELSDYKNKHPKLPNFYTEAEIDVFNRKFARLIASAVGVLMVGLVVFMALMVTNYFGTESPIPAAVFMLFVTVAVPIFIYAGIQKNKYDIARYNRESLMVLKKENEKVERFCGVIMMLATVVFMLWGFLGDAWTVAWSVFPIGGILCGIVAVVLQKE